MRTLFESVPLLLALVAILASLLRWQTIKTPAGKVLLVWVCVNSVVMMMAQSSWWYTVLVLNSSEGEDIANVLWTFFNASVMAFYCFAVSAKLEREIPDAP